MSLRQFVNQKHQKQITLLIVACIICIFGLLRASSIMTQTTPTQTLSRSVLVMTDYEQKYTIHQVINMSDTSWQLRQIDNLSFGIEKQDIWLKVQFPRLDHLNQWLLEVDHAILDKVDVWFIEHNTILSEYHGGDAYRFGSRDIKHEKFLYQVPMQNRDPLTLIMRVQSQNSVLIPLKIWQEKNYLIHSSEFNLGLGLFFGLLLAMGLSSFFFYVTTNSINFLFYSGYAICVCATLATMHGISFKYVWPNSTWIQEHATLFFPNAMLYFAIIFTRSFLEVQKHTPLLDKILKWVSYVFISATLASLFVPYDLMMLLFFIFLSGTIALFFVVTYQLGAQNSSIARIYNFAWLSLLICILIAVMDRLAWVQLKLDSQNLIMLAASFEAIVLALILAFNYSNKQSELETSQQKAKEELEYKVEERTLELQIALRELSETNRELEERNTLDALTNIKNRRFFDKRFLAEYRRARREQTPLSLVMLDIDHFKNVNDNFGHLVGDSCLKHVAHIMKEALNRPQDEVCRYGGEEFAIILPNTDQSGAIMLVEKVREQIENSPLQTNHETVPMTISIGVTTVNNINHDVTENDIINLADKALYQAKDQGRNRVIFKPFNATNET
jgi:diguanylate cyclase (GGDEF)-like protein